MWLIPIGSLFGPVYFAVAGKPFYLVIIWAAVCTALFMWKERQMLAQAKQTAGIGPGEAIGKIGTLMLFIAIAILTIAVHGGAFFIVDMLR